MGYNTRYTLTLHRASDFSPEVEGKAEIIHALRSASESARYCLRDNGRSNECGGWYENESELISFSDQHPEVVFVLHGEGEESGDIWTKYFLDGLVQRERAKVVIEPFDRSKLQKRKA